MRVLHVLSCIDPRSGGTTAAVAGLASAQAEADIETRVAATFVADFREDVAKQLRSRGVPVDLVGPAFTPLRLHKDLATTLHRLVDAVDVVHVHGVWHEAQYRAARIAARLNKPYVVAPHGMLDPWSLSQSSLKKQVYLAVRMRKVLRRASALYYTTETERRLVEPLDLATTSIVEPLGLDLSEFEDLPPRGWLKERHPSLAGKQVLLFLSRIHHKKGLDLLVPAFARVASKHPDVALVIAGPDSPDGYRARIEQLVEEHRLTDRVVFTGMLWGSERIAAMVDADLFVLPSYQENFGIVVIEALAAGLPVLISDQVNMHDDVTRGEVGAVVPTEVPRLAQELERWLGDHAWRRDAAQRSRPFAWENYDWSKIGRRWRDHYARVLAAHARS